MKSKIVKILMLLVISLTTFSCSEDEVLEPSLEVTPITLQGTWKLAELNGEQLPEDFYTLQVLIRLRKMAIMDTFSAESMIMKTATGTTNIS